MEPGRHVDCGHCLDMERGHSSLAPLERVAFRARLSCPGHLVTACHGYRHNLMARLTNPRPTCKQKSQMSLGSPDCCEGPLRQNAHLRNSAHINRQTGIRVWYLDHGRFVWLLPFPSAKSLLCCSVFKLWMVSRSLSTWWMVNSHWAKKAKKKNGKNEGT